MNTIGNGAANPQIFHYQTNGYMEIASVAQSLLGNPVNLMPYLEMTMAHLIHVVKKIWFALFPLESGAHHFERGLVIRARKP